MLGFRSMRNSSKSWSLLGNGTPISKLFLKTDYWEGNQLMSSLIFALSQTEIILATDTLATPYDGAAAFLSSKAFTLPHMSMILAASGDTGFLERWWSISTLGKSFRELRRSRGRSIRAAGNVA